MKKFILSAVVMVGVCAVAAPVSANHSMEKSEAMAAMSGATAVATSVVPATCEFTQNLGKGSRGDEVTCLQQELMKAGLLATLSAPTGNYGDLTVAAVKAWQASHGVAATGYFGQLTREAMHEHVHEALGLAHGDEHDAGTTTEATHTHTALDVSGWVRTPSVAIAMHEDAMGGWNVEVTPKNFTFAPEHVNQAVVAGEGHAHIYINGVKYGRVYGSWMYLPASVFKKGENVVRVTLNANNHSDLAVSGSLVEASATVTLK